MPGAITGAGAGTVPVSRGETTTENAPGMSQRLTWVETLRVLLQLLAKEDVPLRMEKAKHLSRTCRGRNG